VLESGHSKRRLGRPPSEEVPEGERRERILRVAPALFGQRGYAAVSLGEIATGVGVTKPALYHHFSSKEALYTAVMCRFLDIIGGEIRGALRGPEPTPAKIRRLVEVAVMRVPFEADLDALLRDADEHLAPAQREAVTAAHYAMRRALEDLMEEGIAAGHLKRQDSRLLAHAFWQLLAGFVGQRGADAGFHGRPDVAAVVADLFLSGALANGELADPKLTS